MAETRIEEIDDRIYRISTPLTAIPGGFSFNQYLVVDDEPLLFHTGMRDFYPAVRDAIARVMPVEKLRWVAFSHFEQDESGALVEFVSAAPHARAVCSRVAAMVGNAAVPGREPRALADGETLSTGRRALRWLDAPHVPHGWDCGFLFDATSRALFCGDLFTQPGTGDDAVTEADILGPSEAFRGAMEYWAHAPTTRATLEKIASCEPRLLACMHGSAWRGDGARLIRALADAVVA
jgi:flavorubredoxin